jgi:anti-sigma factor RsiW
MNDCQKTQQYIPDAVDGRLTGTEKNFFDDHINRCSVCRNDYELDALTKDFVKTKVTRKTTPTDIAEKIKRDIEKQVEAEGRSTRSAARIPFARAAVIAALVIGAAILFYILNPSDIQHTLQAADIVEQSVENYGLVLAGTIQPAHVGQNVGDLQGYFKDKVDFPVALKPVKECEWVGAVLSDYEGLPLAHLVYKLPAGVIYVYQANWNDVRRGNILSLSSDAISSLDRTGWYVNGSSEDHSIVIWLYNEETICAAVSSIDPVQLKTMFETESNQW